MWFKDLLKLIAIFLRGRRCSVSFLNSRGRTSSDFRYNIGRQQEMKCLILLAPLAVIAPASAPHPLISTTNFSTMMPIGKLSLREKLPN